jgi:two-component system response regulator FlrC
MPTQSITGIHRQLASWNRVNSRALTVDEVIPHLVGHTIEDVERGLILHTLAHHHGSRTISARVLGISIRCIRNKIHDYEELGISVTAPGEPRVPGRH